MKTSKPDISILLLALLWLLMSTFGAGYLSQLEANGLFLFSWDFMMQKLAAPGGALAYLAVLLTQFFHLPWLGSLIWVLLCALCGRLTQKLTGHSSLLSLFPAACATAAAMGLGYMIFKLKLPAHAFTTLLGAICSVALVLLYRKSTHKIPFLCLMAVLGYPLIGFYSLLAVLGAAMSDARSRNWKNLPAAIALIAIVPILWVQLFTTTRPANAYLALVPVFTNGCSWIYYVPYCLMFLFIVFGQLLPACSNRIQRVIEPAVLVLMVTLFWTKDANFNAEMRMARATDSMQWEKSLKAYRRASTLKEPTRIMVLYRNLALIRLGIEGDECFNYRDGSMKQRTPVHISESQQAGRQLFIHFGLPNYTYRWCFENNAETGWSVTDLRYMAMCSIVTENRNTATKYLDILQKTLFYRRWAHEQWQYVQTPQKMEASATYGPILSLTTGKNMLGNDNTLLEIYLNTRFLTEPDRSPEFCRVAMLWAALSQKSRYFWPAFNNYAASNMLTEIPVQYQQAMLLFNWMFNNAEIGRIPFDPEVKQEFFRFQKFFEQHPIEDPEKMEKLYRKEFGNTYYYYYFFHQNQSLVFQK
ncbi:MAG: DUF6057 family protein [Bacteroidaceae bacterium]|nr:DUF6057 family protein [Bacteroidaceae bacterium]